MTLGLESGLVYIKVIDARTLQCLLNFFFNWRLTASFTDMSPLGAHGPGGQEAEVCFLGIARDQFNYIKLMREVLLLGVILLK